MKVRLGAAQMVVEPLDVAANLEKTEFMMRQASREGCDILVFPELFLTGLLMAENSNYARPIPGEHTQLIGGLAARHGLHVVAPLTERDGDDYYNTAVLFDDEGKILGKYRKIYLWNGEKIWKKAGSEAPVFETRFGKIALEICWDLGFPELTKKYALQGARIVLCGSLTSREDKYDILQSKSESLRSALPEIDTESNFTDACVPARAMESAVAYVFSCGWGDHPFKGVNRRLIGHSQIAVPFYGRIGILEEGEGVLIREVDLSLLQLAEEVYELQKDSILIPVHY